MMFAGRKPGPRSLGAGAPFNAHDTVRDRKTGRGRPVGSPAHLAGVALELERGGWVEAWLGECRHQ